MKKLGKKVDELLDSLKKDQSMFTMCCNDDGEFFYAYNAKADEIGAGVATVLSDWFDDKSENSQRAAEGILMGLRAAIMHEGKASDAIMHFLAKVAAERTLDSIKHLSEKLGEISEGGSKAADDEEEDCSTCDANRVCPLPNAIKYRKANGIPAPKKRSKKRCNEHEQGS